MIRVHHTRRITRVQHTKSDSRAVYKYRSRAVHEILHTCGPLRVARISGACDMTKIEEHTRVQRTRLSVNLEMSCTVATTKLCEVRITIMLLKYQVTVNTT